VTGIHSAAHMRAAIVPLRWGAPRILVLSGGFHYHLGENLDQEPFRSARLWRYAWDPLTDLAISRRAPDKLPTYAHFNPTVDRLIENIVLRQCHGPLFDPTILTLSV
jgi:DNA processing protein